MSESRSGPAVEDLDCVRVMEDELVDRYLAGELPESEAVALEAHYFGCDDCWELIRAARSLRASAPEVESGAGEAGATPVGGGLRRRWVPVAATLALAAVAVAVWQTLEPEPTGQETAPTFRGEEAVLDLESALREGTLTLGWDPHPRAVRYVVRLYARDGELLLERRLEATRMEVDLSELPPSAAAERVYSTVDALDELNRVVARAGPVRAPGGPP